MDSYQIEQIIKKGEGVNVEFRLAEQEPQINDKDWFEIYIPINTSIVLLNSFSVGITTPKGLKSTTPKKIEGTTPKSLDNTTKNIGKEIRDTIIKLLTSDPYLSASKIGEKLNISRDGVRYHLQHLKKAKQIRFVDKPQNGFWEIKK